MVDANSVNINRNQSMPNMQSMMNNSQSFNPNNNQQQQQQPSVFQQQAQMQFPQQQMYQQPYMQPMMMNPQQMMYMQPQQMMMPQQMDQNMNNQQQNGNNNSSTNFNSEQQSLNNSIQHDQHDQEQASHFNLGEDQQIIKGGAKNFFQEKSKQQQVQEQQEKQKYAALLAQQIELKKKKKLDEQLQDQQIQQNIDMDKLRKSNYFKQGPERDAYGNINYTRSKPYYPNYQKLDWFTHGQNNGVQDNRSRVNQSISPASQQQQEQVQQQQQEQQQPNESQVAQNLVQNQQQELNNQLRHQGDQLTKFYEQETEFMRKKQAMEVQHQQLMQIEENKKRIELQKLEEKRRNELEELKMLREKAYQESKKSRMQERQGHNGFNRNLFEAGQQVLKLDQQNKPVEWVHKLGNIKKSRKDEYDFDADRVKETASKMNRSEKTTTFKKSDVEGQKKALRDMEDQILIEQRIIKELPIEITKNVRDTVNKELLKLRHEMNLSNNNIGEQLMNLKGQLMKAQDRKGYVNEELRRLHQEIKQTQVVDEIRQREIYDAFMKHQPTNILHNKDKLINPDFVEFSKKVPGDLDYLLNQENYKGNGLFQDRFADSDLHGVLKSQSAYYNDPISVSKIVQPNDYKQAINEVPNFNQKALNQIDQEMNIEYDLANQRNQNNDFSVKQILDDNSRRLDKLIEIDHNNYNLNNNVNSNNNDRAFNDIVQSNIDRSDIAPIRVKDNDEQKIKNLDDMVSYSHK